MSQDHPHACGDKGAIEIIKGILSGSSPRVWGQDTGERYRCNLFRIIPTRVGTRGTLVGSASGVLDHPHTCGDKTAIF